MLDQETKRKIDNARDILVGKVPDPKSQVEQITIALIYKFMDDMDKESEEMGGKATFFTGEYEKYAWSRIFDPRLGGFDLINTYSEAILKMNHNPNIPQLFRDIFKNAYLPYRDPETLKSFLKEINEFHYEHSERLGDAFEYLLSVLGSQGEAGQFRTPRHIIDFIVSVVDPKKNDTIADPACGTAGFLISSYKHILKHNTKKRNGDKLNPDERKRLLNNLVGYDISPDMVRLSLVNMYLHGFSDPKIHEYDTLTSEERWNETFDVLLANPPFMTPKGGIRPHKRFSIKAKRSEVLFVDYIAEHLNPNGRAGVIVPEGIISQSQTAYKQLRKILVENYLWAVVSLPAGVFQPYSGVKTSILLMDKTLAKKTDKILFVRIENDGFDLGAQRRPIDKNDLPQALNFIKEYQQAVINGKEVESTDYAHVVEKVKIAESGDWGLSGERYKDNQQIISQHYEMVQLGDVSIVSSGNTAPQGNENFENGIMPFIRTSDVGKVHISSDLKISNDYVNQNAIDNYRLKLFKKGTILFPKSGASTFLNHRVMMGVDGYVSSHLATIFANEEKTLPIFLFRLICEVDAKKLTEDQNYPSLRLEDIKSIRIPLPPLSVQEEIVAMLDDFQKIIAGAQQVVDNYKPTIKIDPDWEVVELGEIMEINARTINPFENYGESEFIYIDITSVENGTGVVSFDNRIKGIDAPSRARRVVKTGDILLSTVRPNLKAFAFLSTVPDNSIASTGFAVLTAMERVIPKFVYYQLFGEDLQQQMINRMGKGSYPSINQKDVQELQIPIPLLSVQQEIVSQIEEEQEIVNANKKLIAIYKQKIKAKISEVWGESKEEREGAVTIVRGPKKERIGGGG